MFLQKHEYTTFVALPRYLIPYIVHSLRVVPGGCWLKVYGERGMLAMYSIIHKISILILLH